MPKIKFSINIITYNRLTDLKKTLNTLLKQIDNTCEIIITDNSTNNKTKEFIKSQKISAIRYFENKNNNIALARNIGIRKSRGQYIVSVDDDCIPQQNWFKMVKKYSKASDAIAGKVVIPRSTFLGNAISALGFPAGGALGFEKMWKVDKTGTSSHISLCNSIIKKNIITRVGMFDEQFKYGAEDTELAARLIKRGYTIKYVPQLIVQHKPRTNLKGFVSWHINRGKSNYYLKQKMGRLDEYFKMRVHSTLLILNTYKFKKEIILIPFLLALYVASQHYGYLSEKIRNEFK